MSMLIAATLAIASPFALTSVALVGDEVKSSQDRRAAADPDDDDDAREREKAAKDKARRSDREDNRTRDCRRDPMSGRCNLYSSPLMAG